MKPKIIASVLAAVVVCGGVVFALTRHQAHRVRPHNQTEEQARVMPNHDGPMMPPPHFMPHHGPDMGPGPMMPGEPFGGKIKLTDNQRNKIRDLDRNLKNDMKKLHDEEDELRDRYREKIDAVLTDEQYRKIEKMRGDLRRDMKKLHDKREGIMEKHKHAFDSILTPEQKRILEIKHNENHKSDFIFDETGGINPGTKHENQKMQGQKHPEKGFGKPGARDDKDAGNAEQNNGDQ